MSITGIAISALVLTSAVLGVMLALTKGKLKRTEDKLQTAEIKVKLKDSELEVVRDVQSKIKKSETKEMPEKKDTPVSGDSTSRIERLNRM